MKSKAGSLKRQQLLQRQSQLRQQLLQLHPQTRWFKLKGWLYDHSETILVARLTALAGFVITVLGALDWTSLINLDVHNTKQIFFTGAVVLAQGVSVELARRRNAAL